MTSRARAGFPFPFSRAGPFPETHMWTYSIEYETTTADGDVRYGSTAVAADTCKAALDCFLEAHPGSDVREIRRVRHD